MCELCKLYGSPEEQAKRANEILRQSIQQSFAIILAKHVGNDLVKTAQYQLILAELSSEALNVALDSADAMAVVVSEEYELRMMRTIPTPSLN